ncbi:MAG: helix-turn-helix transcriptional regulator [Rikenellaceae bacterium]
MKTEQILKEIGENIKKLRKARGISQQQLADLCDFETSNMSRIEAGKSNFTISTLNKIAIALDVPLINLF